MVGKKKELQGSESTGLFNILEDLLPDVLRKALVTSLGALFMTEEGMRNVISDLKLPKEAVVYLAKQSEKTKGEVLRIVASEFRKFLEKMDVTRELQKVLSGLALEVTTEIHFKQVDNEGKKVKPSSTKLRARIKRKKTKGQSG
ncbi:MAG: hypothetical protein GXP49_12280 [Deltaproteobacteria bacterium]|nr:hypothetical protein [Deltaproteobacteria bacterium]